MGHQVHPTTVPKQLQNNDNDDPDVQHEYDNGDTYSIEKLEDRCLLRVEKNGELLTIAGIHTIVE